MVPFPCSWDGITLVDLNVGDERDFGSMAAGLVGMGWIEPVGEVAPIVVDEPVESTADPVEPVVEPVGEPAPADPAIVEAIDEPSLDLADDEAAPEIAHNGRKRK